MTMNPAHWHLMLNNVPVLGTAFGIVIIALLAIPAYLTGEPAEEIV